MKRLALIVIVFFVNLVFAQENSYTYLVYVSSFPFAPDQMDIPKLTPIEGYTNLRDQGYQAHPQPFRETRQIAFPNTNYILLEVTPLSASQQNKFDVLEAQGRIRLIQKAWISAGINAQTGGRRADIMRESFGAIPLDVTKNWSVQIST